MVSRRSLASLTMVVLVSVAGATLADPPGATDKVTYVCSGYVGSEVLVNFPVLVRLDAAATALLGGAANVIFADPGDGLLDFEVESWQTGGEACA